MVFDNIINYQLELILRILHFIREIETKPFIVREVRKFSHKIKFFFNTNLYILSIWHEENGKIVKRFNRYIILYGQA